VTAQLARGRWARSVALGLVIALLAASCGASPSMSPSRRPSLTASPLAVTASPFVTASPLPSSSAGPTATAEVYAPLDGMPTTAARAALEPIAVTIDDSAVARPQSGFNQASIVYQAPAEGGEMKYMMVFQENDASSIGPLRSGRPHFAAWAAEYRAIFAHFGGDKHLLDWIPSLNGKLLWDISFIVDPGAKRITTRPPPHNAYTLTSRLRTVAAWKHEPATIQPGLATRPFVDDLPAFERPSSASIHVPLPNSTIDYTYDPIANQYLRSVNGKPEIDLADGQRVTARDVVVLFQTLSYGDPLAEPGNRRPVVGYLGTGKALVFHDGQAIVGTWHKSSTGDLTRFYAADGSEIPLLRGRIFIQIVQPTAAVSYR
jgi:Protein of unknown function (DUF3048) N-terminal domain/Protein of unknown function (DUF3048) C-terminal domain